MYVDKSVLFPFIDLISSVLITQIHSFVIKNGVKVSIDLVEM